MHICFFLSAVLRSAWLKELFESRRYANNTNDKFIDMLPIEFLSKELFDNLNFTRDATKRLLTKFN